MLNTHIDLPGSRRAANIGAARVRDADPHAHMEVTIDLAAPALPGPRATLEKTISAQEFARKFGASADTVQTVRRVLRAFGLHVAGVSHGGRSLRVGGTVAAMEAAFQANLAMYRTSRQGEYRGRTGPIMVPAGLEKLITGVFGLDERRMAHRRDKNSARQHPARNHTAAAAPLAPADLEKLYNFPVNNAANQTIAIAEFGVPVSANGPDVAPTYFPDDVTNFCAEFNRPAPNVQIVPVNLTPLTPAQLQNMPPQKQQASVDISGEVMMDVEIAAAMAPGASVLVYFATFDQKGWVDLLGQITSGQPVTPVCLSISWGAPEDTADWTDAARTAINDRLQAASMQGITVCISAGDDGSGDAAQTPGAHLDFPASSPFVLAVGGTMLDGAGQEVAWWVDPGQRNGQGAGATGGGVSEEFQRPAWQNVSVASVNPASIDGRIIPDVAALAGPPFYALQLAGQSAPNGGTSASAPLWAALLARVNAALPTSKQQRFLTPLLYQPLPAGGTVGAAASRDITVGQNASFPNPGVGYTAKAGFDAVTGWGVPDGQKLLAVLPTV